MPKTHAENVRAFEKRRRDRGEKEIRVWVPDAADAIKRVRQLARRAEYLEEVGREEI